MRKPSSFWEHNEKGPSLFNREADDQAIAEFERAVDAAPLPLAALDINLGAAYLADRRYAEARAWLEKALALDPDNPKGHCLLGQVLKAAGAALEARAEFEQTCALDPDSPEGREAEGEILALSDTPGAR
jgi:tetratricopeptide (TPR) repeat protein